MCNIRANIKQKWAFKLWLIDRWAEKEKGLVDFHTSVCYCSNDSVHLLYAETTFSGSRLVMFENSVDYIYIPSALKMRHPSSVNMHTFPYSRPKLDFFIGTK